jgi:polyphosphate kinase
MTSDQKYINRELSWLSFNERVLQEAKDNSVPLIERLRFLGIFSNNLDEFFKVRVAGLHKIADVKGKLSKYDKSPDIILDRIHDKVMELRTEFDSIYIQLIKELREENIFIVDEESMNSIQQQFARRYYEKHVESVLSPVIISESKSFPELRDKYLYLATKLFNKNQEDRIAFALIEIPTDYMSRFIILPGDNKNNYIILLEDLIRFNLDKVFCTLDYDSYNSFSVKITRDAELDIDNDLSKSMLAKIHKGVKGRKRGQAVRFVYDRDIDEDLLQFIMKGIGVQKSDRCIPGGRYHNFKDFINFPLVGSGRLVYKKDPPLQHPLLKDKSRILDAVKQQDVMVHYPYQKFTYFISLLREAAIDPLVTEIKTTIYRVAYDSKIVNALINACRNGKKVTVLVELQARFDEKSNIHWANKLEKYGANVIPGIHGLKVHSKVTLIRRKEDGKKADYGIIGTGNLHEGTARVYTDIQLYTANKKITSDMNQLFSFFEFNYIKPDFKSLFVSPYDTRSGFETLIENEIENAERGIKAIILLKVNNLVDYKMIDLLYRASNAGVKIRMIIRGMCSLIPGVPGLSENIEVISIVDKYLEHSRIFYFYNGGNEDMFISSADWMTRNLDHRIEVTCPVYDTKIKSELKNIFRIQFKDNVKAREINSEHSNTYRETGRKRAFRSQIETYKHLAKQLNSKDNEGI